MRDPARDIDFKTVFTGKQNNSVPGIANQDCAVATVVGAVMNRMFERKVVAPAQITAMYKSATFPTTGYGHAHSLHPEAAARIKQAFFTFEREGAERQHAFKQEGRFVALNHQSDWKVIRQIDAANSVRCDCK